MPWKAGQSGNPKGRPPKEKAISEAMRELIHGKTIAMTITYDGVDADGKACERKERMRISATKNLAYGVAATVIAKALKGDMLAAKELIDRMEGKAPTDIRLDANVSNIDTSLLDGDEKKQLAAIMGKVLTNEE